MSQRKPDSTRLRVLIVDQHDVSRAAIGALLRTEGLVVVADVADRDQALVAGTATGPDVVLVDLGADPQRSLASARALARLPSAPAVLLTSSVAPDVQLDGFAFVAKSEICARRIGLALRPQITTTKESKMSMQAYLDNITAKTGKTPDELIELARVEGLLQPGVSAGQLATWLRDAHGLGHGHAMAIVAQAKRRTEPRSSAADKITQHFSGKKSGWRPVYDQLVRDVNALGSDTDVLPGKSYLSLRKAGRKFAIVQVTADRLDIGIKLKGVAPQGRLEPAGSWNSMVTHRVRVRTAGEVDTELFGWLERAYTNAA